MAFALPSFNAAVASANTSGAPLQRLQANIDFDDVKSDIATKYMTKLPLEEFITEANIAKQALAEYGAGLRNKMTLDHNMKISEMQQKENKRSALINLLKGDGKSTSDMQLDKLVDPQTAMERELVHQQRKRNALYNEMGAFHPDYGQVAAGTAINTVPLPGTDAVYQNITKTENEAPLKLELPQSQPGYVEAFNLLMQQGQQPQKTK
tara:strand:- start:10978 stop:11601 length:624 start_codon:yes stop_codon:yes gene_type:complete